MAVPKPMAAAVQARQRISVVRDNFVAGGILPEGDYDITGAKYIIFAYATKDGKPTGVTTCALQLKMLLVDAAAGTAEQEQIYSVGAVNIYAPSEDGNFVEAVGGNTTLSNQSNFNIIHESLVNAGMPEKLFDDTGAKLLIGVRCHIAHIPAPDRSAMQAQRGVTGSPAGPQRDLPKTIPVVKSILVAPWDTKGGTKVSAKVTPAKATVAAAPVVAQAEVAQAEDGGTDRLAGYLLDILTAAGGKLAKAQVRLKTHQRYGKDGVDATVRDAEMAIFNDADAMGNLLAAFNAVLNDDGSIQIIGD